MTWPKMGLIVKMKIQMARGMNGLKRPMPRAEVAGTQTSVASKAEKKAPRTANCKYTQNIGFPGIPPTGSSLSSLSTLFFLPRSGADSRSELMASEIQGINDL